MSTETGDLFEDSQLGPAESEIRKITAMALEVDALEAKNKALGISMKANQDRINTLTFISIPEAMDSAGTTKITGESGITIELKETISGSLPKDEEKRARALDWVVDHDGEDLIKDQVTATFEKGQTNIAGEIIGIIEKMGVEAIRKRDINHMTLKAWARERLAGGFNLDAERLGLWVGRTVKIKRG